MFEEADVLCEHQRRVLLEFQSETQIQDRLQAIHILKENHWHLENAVQNRYLPSGSTSKSHKSRYEHIDDDQDSPSSTSALLGSSSSSSSRRSNTSNKRFLLLFMWPFTLAWKISWQVFQCVARLLYRPSIAAPRCDARSEADRFLREFESTFGTTHPNFFSEGGYTQALNTAKTQYRYLLVILSSEEHDDHDKFCRDTLTHPDLLEFLHHHQIIVWGGNVRYTEAFQVSNTLQATTFPFLAIIALQPPPPSSSSTSTSNTSSKMAVVDRIEGPISAASMIRRFESVMLRIDPSLTRLRNARRQLEQERQLRQQQDQAYRDALEADQRKQEEAESLLRQKKEDERVKALHHQQRQQYIQWLCTQVQQEITGKATKISFRLANGERVIRRFGANQTLVSLYMFVEAYPYLNDVETEQVEAPKGYVHKYGFRLHSPFPRTEYGPDENIKIEDVKGLWPSATLIVDLVEEDEDEEEEV